MAEAEVLRQLTLAAKAKLSLGSSQLDDLDENVLAGTMISPYCCIIGMSLKSPSTLTLGTRTVATSESGPRACDLTEEQVRSYAQRLIRKP